MIQPPSRSCALCIMFLLCLFWNITPGHADPYVIVDTGQSACYDDAGPIPCPVPGQAFFGQDAQYLGNAPMYKDNKDGTVSDLQTGLMWVKERYAEISWEEARQGAAVCRVGGYDDWRMPTIKELYSLIDFRGTLSPEAKGAAPWIDTRYFDFAYGDTSKGKRSIDSQDWSATRYTGTTMDNASTAFGVNFADGRIKGYPIVSPRGLTQHYVRYVRENPEYGQNDFEAKEDGTVVDAATSLVWQQDDSGAPMDWQSALSYCENLELAEHDDWRLPNAKELQSIVDYTRSPLGTGSAAIDPVFNNSETEAYFWTSTTHIEGQTPGSRAVYIAFGQAMGYFAPPYSGIAKKFMDVHGAGAQRSDPKSGDPGKFPRGFGPQGDDIRIFNYARCVRGGVAALMESGGKGDDTPPWGYVTGIDLRPEKRQPPEILQKDPTRLEPRSFGVPRQPDQQGGPVIPSPRIQGRNSQTPGQTLGPRYQRPPRKALEACAGKTQGQVCLFLSPRGNVNGICRTPPGRRGQGLACVPKGGPASMQ